MSRSYSARSLDDMEALAHSLLSAPETARPALAANIMAEGLMLPQQWWTRVLVWLAKRRHGVSDYQAWAFICSRAPEVADELIEQTAEWIVNGKDAHGEGAGGFDQREVDTMTGMLLVVSDLFPADAA